MEDFERETAAVAIQKLYRYYKTRQNIRKSKIEKYKTLGFDVEYQCPYTHSFCYEIPEELHMVLNMGEGKKICHLLECLKWINQFDFLSRPKHHWGSEMEKYEFEKIVDLGGLYLSHLYRKLASFTAIENRNYKKIKNYEPILEGYITYLKSHIENVKELLSNIGQINYYRNFNEKKFQELEKEYASMMNGLFEKYCKHPLIEEQTRHRHIKLQDSICLNMYQKGFLEAIESEIDRAEKLRIHIDELLVRAGLKKPSSDRYPVKEGYQPCEVEASAPLPSAPLYPNLDDY